MTGPFGTSSLITVSTCTLNQWSLDFDGNLERIVESCRKAKEMGATYRLGPELEICGYGCEDHFFEQDTFAHCWESLYEMLHGKYSDITLGLLCDFGMPVLHKGIRYNCRVICYNQRILYIRPKIALADAGNYRESRYFTAYNKKDKNSGDEIFLLPRIFHTHGQRTVNFGIGYIQSNDGVTIGCESCEELWTPNATHISLSLNGVEIIGNGSGSHHELRKLNARLELMINATRKCGGIYLYSNQRGCDGGRCYYDGGAIIVSNGKVLAQAKQFSIDNVEVITATVDLDDVRSYRASIPSFGIQAVLLNNNSGQNGSGNGGGTTGTASSTTSSVIDCNDLSLLSTSKTTFPTVPPQDTTLKIHTPEEECCLGPACWLWDYLRRSGASGFLLPLSGGADSSSVATIVGAMTHLVYDSCVEHGPTSLVAQDVRRICRKTTSEEDALWIPSSPQELCNYILHTIFMGTKHSSDNTKSRAKRLGDAVGSYHLNVPIDMMVDAMLKVFTMTTPNAQSPRFEAHGGTLTEDLALQNIQARLRMVTAYLYAQLLPWVRGRSSGFLLVLGSANVDEGLRGYMTKYDCSSADLNPIGAISKGDLKRMLLWASTHYQGYEVLGEIAGAPPTAELRPLLNNNTNNTSTTSTNTTTGEEETATTSGAAGGGEHSQLDEDEMGMTYAELGAFGTLRKIARCGPVSMYRKLRVTWNHLSAMEVATKVKRFFYYYSVNRHKMCTLTPAYHAEGYSPDDNRFDLRQFLYNTKWPRQFTIIDKLVKESEEHETNKDNTAGGDEPTGDNKKEK